MHFYFFDSCSDADSTDGNKNALLVSMKDLNATSSKSKRMGTWSQILFKCFSFVQVIQRNATCSCFRMAKFNAAQIS